MKSKISVLIASSLLAFTATTFASSASDLENGVSNAQHISDNQNNGSVSLAKRLLIQDEDGYKRFNDLNDRIRRDHPNQVPTGNVVITYWLSDGTSHTENSGEHDVSEDDDSTSITEELNNNNITSMTVSYSLNDENIIFDKEYNFPKKNQWSQFADIIEEELYPYIQWKEKEQTDAAGSPVSSN